MISSLTYIVSFYILGIIIGNFFILPVWLTILLLFFNLSIILFKHNNQTYNRLYILSLFVLIGLLNFQIRNLPLPKTDISHYPINQLVTIVGQVDDEPRVYDDRIFFTLKGSYGKLQVSAQKTKLSYGHKVKVQGKLQKIEGLANPGVLSFADYLKNQGVTRQLSSRAPPKIISRGSGNPLKTLSISLKKRIRAIHLKTLPEPYATLLTSIVLGSKAGQAPKEIKETYKKAGVAHLLVASGMHLGILVGVCLFLVRLTRLPLWLAVLLLSLINFFYALMTGFGPSILRAAIMAEIMLFGLLFEREKEIYTSLSLAAFIILLFEPKALFNVGFQLSFAATLSLVYIAPIIQEKLKKYLPRSLAVIFSVALSPVLVTIPITIFHFSQASLIGVVTNIILLPWVGVVVIMGFVSSVLGLIMPFMAEVINSSNLVLLYLMDKIVSTLALLPFAQVFMAVPTLAMIIAYYFGLVCLVEVLRRKRLPKLTKFRRLIIVLAVICLLFWHFVLAGFGSSGLIITILDVGQGDSILIEAPAGKKILVDGGDFKMGERIVLPFLRRKGINQLDLMILTHAHSDHLAGLLELLPKIKVKQVLDSGLPYETQAYRNFLDLIKQNEIKYSLARAGARVKFAPNLVATILHPSMPFLHETNSDPNNNSIAFRLKYQNFSMMFTADNEQVGEKRILETFNPSHLASTILKIGHHGSSTSTSLPFLTAVSPQAAIISCGRQNKFRHPHRTTLSKFKNRDIKIFRTDRDGAVIIRSDGSKYWLSCLRR